MVAAVAVGVAAGAGIYLVARDSGGEDELPEAVRAELALVARDVIERGSTPGLGQAGEWRACGVRVIGADPPTLTSADQARTVYVWAMCGTGGAVSSSSLIPVAVHLTDPPTSEGPGDGSRYGPDIRRIFPERLQDAVFDDNHAAELEPAMSARVTERS
ncbi:hypothetical protein GCM10023107_87970 [Actinoplanes octamycinicus]|nr:hypothetical protein Aoc01nite_79000 [Actinoplanes octamycinicus]